MDNLSKTFGKLTIPSLLLLTICFFALSAQADMLPITVPNGDFEEISKPGTGTPGILSGNSWTQGVGPDCPIDNGMYEFADTTTGDIADIPGWLGYDRQGWIDLGGTYDRDQTTGNLQGSINRQHNHTPDGLNCYHVTGGQWGNPAGGLITSAEPLGNVEERTYTLSMFANGSAGGANPVVLELLAGGTALTPTSSVSPDLSSEWQEFSRTYDSASLVGHIGEPLTIVLGVGRPLPDGATGPQSRFDDVTLFRPPDVLIAPVAVLADPATTSEVRTSLPDSITAVSQGSTYYVEIWASDVGSTNTGLTGVYVDVSFCSEMSAVAVEHGTIFTTFPSGTIQWGGVDEFGGSLLPSGGGIEPEWVRVGWLEMRADADVSACTISLLPSLTGVGVFDRAISWGSVGLGSVTLHRDCNGNGIPDVDDIAIGTSGDCNGNGIPDECDIADGDSNDCNGNGIPDECDIADGTSTDFNIDGVPDECQLDVRIEPVVVLNDPNGMSEVRIMLPGSMPAVVRGSRYYVEIWATDMGDTNTGLTSVYVDLSFCGQASATAVEHGTTFTTSPSGTIQPDGVDEFGGSALPSGGGIEPDWVRIGWITMIPDVDVETCTISLLPSLSGVEALDRGSIPWEFVNLGSVELEILPPLRSYDLDSDGFIRAGDLGLFAGSWLMDVPPGDEMHDFDCDCYVGVGDLSWFATGWLKDPNDPTVIYPPCPEPNCAGGSMLAANKTTFESAIINASLVSVSTETLIVPADVAFELVVLDAPSASDTTTALPASIHNITNGQTYYLEIWISDVGYIDTGVTAAYVDLSFPDDAASLTNIFHGGIFKELEAGSNDVPGEIDEVGGSTLSGGVGVDPQWARLAVVEMYADATPPSVTFALSPSSTGVSAWGRGTIPWDNISLASVAIAVSDFDHDGDVDFDDLAELISYWLQEEASVDVAPYPTADGIVNLQDFALLGESWLGGTE